MPYIVYVNLKLANIRKNMQVRSGFRVLYEVCISASFKLMSIIFHST